MINMATDILLRLQEQLKHSHNELKWVYHEEFEMYKKHTQYLDDIPVNTKPEIPMNTKPEIPMNTKPDIPVNTKSDIPVNTKSDIPVNAKSEIPVNTKPEIPVSTKPEIPVSTKPEIPVNTKVDSIPKNKAKTKNIISPMEIILQESNTFPKYEKDVKAKLIEEVSQKEYNKVFGLKKTSEIMSGITNNRWNKSIALYISFLFDKTVKYNNADILYNSEKNNGIIIV